MISKTPEAQKRASQNYRDRMIEEGYKIVNVWVPVDKIEQVKEYAKQLRRNEGL